MGKGINLLITGGYGFIGHQFLKLAQQSEDIDYIVVVDKLTYAATNAPSFEYTIENTEYGKFYKTDICNRENIEYILKEHDIHAVVNFAAETHVDNSIVDNTPFINTNVMGVYSILEALRKVWGNRDDCKFIQVSTDEVYGEVTPGFKFFEQSPYNPRNPYSATKAFGDHMTIAYGNTYGINVVVSHCSNNYGPGQHEEKLIPKTIQCALAGHRIPIYGNGKQTRDWIYVEDHADAIMTLLLGGCRPLGKHYCIGANNVLSNLDIVNKICDILDRKIPKGQKYNTLIKHVADRPGHDMHYAIDPFKMAMDFGWHAKTNFDKGLEMTVDHYLSKWYGSL